MEYGEHGGSLNESAAEETVDWSLLVERVRAGNPDGMEQLYLLFERGIRVFLIRRLGPQDIDDKIHDVFLIVVQAIRRGDLREPERLMGFIRTIVRRQVASHIDQMVHSRREEVSLDAGALMADASATPENDALGQERLDLIGRTLRGLSGRDREILVRFYLKEETQEKICREMDLTDTQFRLLKSRAKARFGELGRRRLETKARKILVRTLNVFKH